MQVLLTGGAGFIGSHIARKLLEEGHQLRIVDNLSTGKIENIAPILNQVDFLKGDLSDLDTARAAVDGMEYVLHQAAIPSVPRSIADPITSNNANIVATLNLLVAARDAQIKRLVYAASSSAYGNTPELPKVETMPSNPLSPYAIMKATGEQFCKVFYKLHGLETVCLRYFNVFGPRQDPKSQYAAVVPKFISALLNGEEITVHGDGEQSRDFTFVANVVQANLKALTAANAPGEVINVACGRRYTLNYLVDLLATITETTPKVTYFEDRIGDVKHSLADISKAERILGYKPEVLFDEGVRVTFNWLRSVSQDAGKISRKLEGAA